MAYIPSPNIGTRIAIKANRNKVFEQNLLVYEEKVKIKIEPMELPTSGKERNTQFNRRQYLKKLSGERTKPNYSHSEIKERLKNGS